MVGALFVSRAEFCAVLFLLTCAVGRLSAPELMLGCEARCRFFPGGMWTKYTVEDGVHETKLPLQIECVRERLRIKIFRNPGIGGNALPETRIRFPRRHGVFLHRLVSI